MALRGPTARFSRLLACSFSHWRTCAISRRISCGLQLTSPTGIHTSSVFSRRPDGPPADMLIRNGKRPKIPKDESGFGELVYVGSLQRQMYSVKFLTLTSSIVGLCIQPMLYQEFQKFPVVLGVIASVFCGFFVYLTPILFHLVVKKYVLRFYYNPENKMFTAVTLKFIPLKRFTTFSRNDVEIPATAGMFTQFKVRQGGKSLPLFVNPDDFFNQHAYAALMKYDEPMDILQNDASTKESR